jgi:hypothetical protein
MNGIMTKITLIVGSVVVFSMMISSYLSIFSEGELVAQWRGTISVDQAVALPLTTADGNQVKVVINYNIEDESLVGQRINAVMGIYDRNNGSLIKLSSFPNGFAINNTEGTTQLATSLTDPVIQNISAIVTLTSADKSEKYSNDVRADLDLRTILPTTLSPLLEDIPPSQTEESTEEDEDSSSSNGVDSEEEE